MASAPPMKSSLKEDLTCPICCDLFRDPVMLSCMHHFCRSCISGYSRSTVRPVTCPQCRKEFTSKDIQTNYLVSAMVDKVRVTFSDAYKKSKEKELSEAFESHRRKMEDFIKSINKDKDTMNTIKGVGDDLQARVKSDFKALHQILEDEETRMLEQLRRKLEEELEKVQRHLEVSEQAAREVEANMLALQQCSPTMDDITPTQQFPPLRPSVQVDMAPDFDKNGFSSKYLAPLQYMVWRKMFKSLKPGPSPLTFDVNTAHPSIYVDRSRTIAVECEVMAQHTNHAKRFLQCVNILAAQGFQSGRRYWEVEVGSSPKWDLGVASEAVDRHARIKLSPENGYWTLRLRNQNEYWAGTQPWMRLQVRSSPQRIGVYVDFDERRVSFYDADDMCLLCSFSNGPRGKAYPFFSPCISDNRNKSQSLKLIHYPPMPLSA